jgi:ATP-binding cassette, subfamily B, bacterial MsbA
VTFRWRWFLALVGVALLAGTYFLAAWSFEQKDAARAAAGDRLDRTRDAGGRVLHDLLAEMHATLADADPAAPPALFESVTQESGPGVVTDVETIRLADPDAWARFGRGAVRVWRRLGPEAFLSGRVPLDELKRHLESDPDVGGAGAGRSTRLEFVDVDGEVVFPRAESRDEKGKHHVRGLAGLTRAQRQIQSRTDSHRDDEGRIPEQYKDASDKLVLGSWAPVPGVAKERLWVLVEVRDAEVVRGAGGFLVELGGREFGEAMAWHFTLGLGLLLIVASALLWIPSRGGKTEVGVLLRTYSFARPYLWGIVFALAVGAVYGFSRAYRAVLAKSLFEDVLVGSGPEEEKIAAIWWIVWQTLALGAITAITNFGKEYLQNYYATAMMADVRIALSRKIISLPLSFFNRVRTGDLLARIERDVAGMRQVLANVFDKAFVQPFTMVASVVIAFILNWKLALVLFGLPILVVPVFRIAKRIKKRAEKRQNLAADMSHVQLQMLVGIRVVKAFQGEERESHRLESANRRFIREARRIARLTAVSSSLLDFLQMAGGAIVVGVGGYYVMRGEVEVGDLAGFMVVMISVYDAAKDITSVLNKLIESLPAVQRVFEIFDTKNDLVDGSKEAPPGPLQQGIELRGVRFRYGELDVLRGIDLLVPAGKVVAVVGPTGAGKSTLCDLVARFYDPTEGAVLWDGVDAREYTTASLSSKLAIVTQDAFLFNAPIDENIGYGREGATQAEIEEAARDANVHDEIAQMEGGYSKLAGERGTSLSGGQRQRVTIARALIKDAPVLILDEATSSLDSHSEKRVQEALARLMAGRTVIVVAHRLSTIRNADKVVVVDEGRIVEEGTPDELLARTGGRFRAMYELQTGTRGAEPDPSAERAARSDA